jgi:hypothetical protein
VTYYAAALGRPVLLAAFPEEDLDPDSPVAEFGRTADRLRPDLPLRAQIDEQINAHRHDRFARMTELASSDPGRSAALLRSLFYRILDVAEPAYPAQFDGLAPTAVRFTPPTSALRVLVWREQSLLVARYPESADPERRATADHIHLSVREDTPDFGALRRADLILSYTAGTARAATDWLDAAARENPHASMVAACTAPGRAIVRRRDGQVLTLHCTDRNCDPAPLVSALLADLDLAERTSDQAFDIAVGTGSSTHSVRVTPWPRVEVNRGGSAPRPGR